MPKSNSYKWQGLSSEKEKILCIFPWTFTNKLFGHRTRETVTYNWPWK